MSEQYEYVRVRKKEQRSAWTRIKLLLQYLAFALAFIFVSGIAFAVLTGALGIENGTNQHGWWFGGWLVVVGLTLRYYGRHRLGLGK